MKNKSHEVSDSDDSESVDNPSPVPLVESTRLEISKINVNKQSEENESIVHGSMVVPKASTKSVDNSPKKKTKSSMQDSDTANKKSSGNDTADVQATFNASDLSPDDEVYIFHCPENFKMEELLNKTIDLSKSKQFVHTKNGKQFHLEILNSENKQVTLAVPQKSTKGKLFNLPLKGHIVIQRLFETKSNPPNDLHEVEDKVVFPNDIKTRHPFLGVNWKSYIDSARVAIEKNQYIRKMRKKMKKEKINDVDIKSKKRKSSSEIPSPEKKKKNT